jgi:DNA-directed RNA polymerase subunit beta
MFQILYRELLIAHNNYVKEVDFGKEDSKMFLNENYVIECLLGVHPHMRGSSTLELSNPYSPISELKNASKIIKTGPGGIPNKESFKKEHRNIHNSYIGNISANFNSEYAEIGIINYSTLNPSLTKLGSYGTKEIDNNTEGWEYVSLNEGLVPNVNQGDSARLHLASWHRSQATPTKNSDVPIVATGAEYMVGQLSSSKFIKLAPNTGEVLEVKKDEYVKVKYIDGTIQYIDITPRLSSTKRASYMMIDFKTLEKDDLFDEGQAISWSNSFNKDGIYAGGKNLKTAILNYRGYGFEDGYVLTEDISKKFEIDVLEEVNVLIPPNTKLLYVNDKIGDVTKKNDVLLEFTYMGSVDEYIDKFVQIDNMSSEDEIAFYTKNIDNIKLHSPGGEIVLIKVFINNKNLTDPSILNLWENNNSKLKEKIKLYSTGMISDKDKLTSTDNIDTSVLKTGSHKHYGKLFDGTKISFFIKQSKNIKIGDKMCNRYGAKGVNTYIIPNDKKPRCESLGDIDIFIAPTAILGRKNLVIIKELYLGKILYLFPDILSKMANNTKTKTKDILDLILTVYTELDASRDRRYISAVKKKFNKIKPEKLREMIKNKELRLNFFVQPFENISFDKLKNTAELLNIELDEYVYIPELDSWTKEKVPVGINYFNIMEQISSDFETVRSVGAYNTISGQPKQGGREGYSSQAIGNLDIYNLLSYDCPNIMKALMTVRSDDFKSKRIVEMNIIQNGFASLPQHTGNARSRSLKKVHLICMGLDVRTEE